MTISLAGGENVGFDAESNFSTNPAVLTLASTEGNLQVVLLGHRNSSLTPSITGDGWSTVYLEETQITNSSARRALAMWWRVVPAAQSSTITVDWSGANTSKVAVGLELTTDTAGGTWSFEIATGRNTNNNVTTSTASLASNSVTPQNSEAIAIDTVVTRHGAPSDEDSYTDTFIIGPGTHDGTGSTHMAVFAGYKIVNITPAAISTTAQWTTSALATSIIGVWSVSAGGPQDLNVPFHQQVTGFFPATLSLQDELNLNPSRIDSTTQIFAPAVANQEALELNPARIESSVQLFLPTISIGSQTLQPARIESTDQLFIPSISNDSPLTLNIPFGSFPTDFFIPTLESQPAHNLELLRIPTTTQLFRPFISLEGGPVFEPILAGNGSLADQIMAGLVSQGFLVGTLADRERARLLSKLTLTEPQNLTIQDLYRLANETNRIAGLEALV